MAKHFSGKFSKFTRAQFNFEATFKITKIMDVVTYSSSDWK